MIEDYEIYEEVADEDVACDCDDCTCDTPQAQA